MEPTARELCRIDLTIRNDEYDYIRDLVYRYSGIELGKDKFSLVVSRICERLKHLKMRSIQEYCEYLKKFGKEREINKLIDVISTNHTYFFREKEHFKYLSSVILPNFERSNSFDERFTIWSAGCSSGEESYTIAIMVEEYIKRNQAKFRYDIDCSDISFRMLEKADIGLYGEKQLKCVSQAEKKIYFDEVKSPCENDKLYRVKSSLRKSMNFFRDNLVGELDGLGRKDKYHVVFCRNVMIYFDKASQLKLIENISKRLFPGGYLIIGHVESLIDNRNEFNYAGPSIYQKL